MASLFREVLSVPTLLGLSLVSLGLLGGLSLLLSQLFGITPLRVGPIILLFLALAVVVFVFNLVFKKNFDFDNKSIIAMVLVTAIIVGVYIYLPQTVPEVFSVATQELQSVVGLGG